MPDQTSAPAPNSDVTELQPAASWAEFFREFEPSAREQEALAPEALATEEGAPAPVLALDRTTGAVRRRAARLAAAGGGGAVAVHAGGDEPEEQARPPLRQRVRAAALELNPWHICRGYPVAPSLAFAGLALTQSATILAFYLFLPESISLGAGADQRTITIVGGILGASASAFNSVGGFGFGYLADRGTIRRTTLLRIGGIVGRVAALGMGFAGAPLAYVGFFILTVVGLGLVNPARSIYGDVYPIDVRVRLNYFEGKAAQAASVVSMPAMGLLSLVVGWQWSLAALGALGLVPAVAAWRVREPRRGEADRRAAGVAMDAEEPPVRPLGAVEAVRSLTSVRSVRLLCVAFAMAGMGGGGIIAFSFVFFAARFNVGAAQRSVLLGAVPALLAFLVLAVQGEVHARYANSKPGRLLVIAAALLVLIVPLDLALVAAPNLPIAVALYAGIAGLNVMTPLTILGVLLAVLPARVRSLGLEAPLLAAVILTLPYQLYAYWMLPVIGNVLASIDPSYALGAVIVLPLPCLVASAVIAVRAGASVDDDIRTMLATAAAEAESRESRDAGRSKMVVCRDVDVRYGAVHVVAGIDFDVEEGEIVALLGTNGAGKSTLLRAIAGVQQASAGAIFLDGEDITHVPPHRNAAHGVILVPGGHAVFPTLTVAENLRVAAHLHRKDPELVRERIETVHGYFPVLRARADQLAGNLSGGEQQMVALSQAFLMRPRLLMIDELSLGLAPQVVETLLEIVRRIRDQGTTVLLVEQSVNVALTIASRAVFMDRGRIRFDGPVSGLFEQRDVVRSVFLGESRRSYSMSGSQRAAARPDDDRAVLQVTDVELSYGGVRALSGVSLDLHAGEVVGIVGANGAGKTTLFDVISGFASADAGRVVLGADDVTGLGPDVRARLGLSRSFQNVSLFSALTVRDNILVAMERTIESRSTVAAMLSLPQYRNSERRARRRVDGLLESLGLERYANKFLRELSTGSRRIVDIACILAANPSVLLLDEPSSGLAQAEVEELGPVIRRIIKETGAGVLVIEHDMTLVQTVSDRLVCMHLGAVLATGDPAEVLNDREVVTALMGNSNVGARSGEAVPALIERLSQT